jgi:hypothetical protein
MLILPKLPDFRTDIIEEEKLFSPLEALLPI